MPQVKRRYEKTVSFDRSEHERQYQSVTVSHTDDSHTLSKDENIVGKRLIDLYRILDKLPYGYLSNIGIERMNIDEISDDDFNDRGILSVENINTIRNALQNNKECSDLKYIYYTTKRKKISLENSLLRVNEIKRAQKDHFKRLKGEDPLTGEELKDYVKNLHDSELMGYLLSAEINKKIEAYYKRPIKEIWNKICKRPKKRISIRVTPQESEMLL